MALFGKKPDPISARSKVLSAEISALEAQIRQLSGKMDHTRQQPKARFTSRPNGASLMPEPAAAPAPPRDPIFEQLDYRKQKTPAENENGDAHYNDLGVRKYDLLGAVRRARGFFRTAPAANPKLVSYLAAGSIRGLRPLRYEKRIARNRFLLLSAVFVLILWGILAAIFNQR